jgi:coenzyme F420-0:L-glutamate ligase
MEITGIKTSLFKVGENLEQFILAHVPDIKEGDILVITSKIVALSQNRIGNLEDKVKLIHKESKQVIKTPWALLTLTDDGWGINAGVDESNANNHLILLPKAPFSVASTLQKKIKKRFSLKKCGILITDTRSAPLRIGTTGRAIGFAGFRPIRSYISKKDLFGRKSRFTKSNLVDALAGSAVLLMGEGDEQVPLVVIRNAPVNFLSRNPDAKEKILHMNPQVDIFKSVFNKKRQK